MPSRAAHILSYAQTLDGGGVERVLLRLAAGWIAAGRRVTVLLGSADGPLAAEVPKGIEVVPLRSASYGAMLAAAGEVVRRSPDLLFCPGNHYTGAAAWTRLRLGAACPPIVAKASNTFARQDQSWPIARGYRAWLRCHPRFIDHLVALSPALAVEAHMATGMPHDRVSVIANPPARYAVDEVPLPLPEAPFVLGVGRLEPQKRWDRLIEAFSRVEERTAHLVVLGEGSMRAALAARIEALGLAERVHLPGHALDPRPAMRRAAVVALTSDYEGAPGALREAIAQGAPVVATDASPAVREIVALSGAGTLVAKDDGVALAQALATSLEPGRTRPPPLPEPGIDAAAAYLELFDRIVAGIRV